METNAVEFRLNVGLGDYRFAYGTYRSRHEYAVDHAPTQKDFDAVANYIDQGGGPALEIIPIPAA